MQLDQYENHTPRHLTASVRAVFERRPNVALENSERIFEMFPDPEAVFYAARNVAFFGERRALAEFQRALDRGFVLYRALLKDDAWLDPLRSAPEFQRLIDRSRDLYLECVTAYVDADGERLLGPVPSPEAVEQIGSSTLTPGVRVVAGNAHASGDVRRIKSSF